MTDDDIRETARQATLYLLPSVIQYRTMSLQALDPSSANFVGLGRWLVCDLPGPQDTDVFGASRDTPYLYAWLDLRAEPWVVTVPPITPTDRYWASQWNDMNGHIIGNLSALDDSYDGGDFLLAGPDWSGEVPAGITRVLRSETSIVGSITRIEVTSDDDMDEVRRMQLGFGLQPLSSFTATPPPSTAAAVAYPPYPDGLYQEPTAAFFDLAVFLLQFASPDPIDAPILQQMATIGIVPGAPWSTTFGADPTRRDLVLAGAHDAVAQMHDAQLGRLDLGARAEHPLYGTRQTMQDHYTHLAFGVWTGIFGNVATQAAYRGWRVDSDNEPVNGANHAYQVTMTANDQAQVRFFWSVTIYSQPDLFLYDNPQRRYAISSRKPDLIRDADGSITLYLQHHTPGADLEPNWIPAPAGPFIGALRLYGPGTGIQDGRWNEPPIHKRPSRIPT